MDSRYEHPQVTALWGLPWTYDAWYRIEQAVVRAQVDAGLIPKEAMPIATGTTQPDFGLPDVVLLVQERETRTKHDVAAFLSVAREWWSARYGPDAPDRWLHFGLTSSDIVDTAQGLRFQAMQMTLEAACRQLTLAVSRWVVVRGAILGRTHGQAAEPTSVGVRAAHWQALVQPARDSLLTDTHGVCRAKISGPVGTYAHIPPVVEKAVAAEFGLRPVEFGGSQIAPRGPLGRWANSAAELVQACAKVAMDIRLMATHGELMSYQSVGQIGSSSMPHKNNPILAEQITGLARLAAGYAAMLQPLDLWLERDISHSCVERVAVPDLWHVVMHTIKQTCEMLDSSWLNPSRIEANLENDANAAWVRHTMLGAIEDGMSYEDARAFGLCVDVESYDLSAEAIRTFLADYPRPEQ